MMTISIHAISVETFVPMLTTLSTLLDKGAEHARAQGKTDDDLLAARLAPDMHPLSFQVVIACRHARGAIALLTGQKEPEAQFSNMTFDQLKTHLVETIDRIKSVNAQQLDGAEDRHVEVPLQEPRYVSANGLQVLRDWSLPNFWFHVVTAYDILRNQGVVIGKRDFMGGVLGPHIKMRG